MFRLGLLLIIALGIVAAVTNPGIDDHKRIVYRSLPGQIGAQGLMAEISGEMLGSLDLIPLTYHNYVLFSTTSFRENTMSVGLLTRVWPTDADMLPERR